MKNQTNPLDPPPSSHSPVTPRLTATTASTNSPQVNVTQRTLRSSLTRSLLPALLLPALLSCNADGTMPTLLDSEARVAANDEPMSEELRRLRKLQEVTWTVDDGTGAVEYNAAAADLVPLIFNSCKLVSGQAVTPGHPCSIAGGQPSIANTDCGFIACTDAFVHLCTAHEILRIADSLTDVGYSFTESAGSTEVITVPPQSAPARADLRKQAMAEAKLSLETSFGLLLDAQTSTTCAASPSSVGNDITKSLEYAPRGLTVGVVAHVG